MLVDTIKEKKIEYETYKNLGRFNNNIPITDKINNISNIILNSISKDKISKIYLFGSYAFGNPKEYSDIDICVIIKNTEFRPEIYTKISMLLDDNDIIPFDLIVSRENEFNQGLHENPNSIENSILKYGKLLYA
jgi:predicted nucleotidyltransferase